jgi:hypothetical protein
MKTKIIPAYQRSDSFILLVYALLIFLFLLLTRTFFSGFHLIDDQTYIILNAKYQHESFLSAAIDAARDDLQLRFRPLAMVYYVAIAKWIYPSFTGIAILLALQGIFSCYFFYLFARLQKCGLLLSFLFPLFILVGNQGVVFWRNCMSETLCMLLVSVSLYFLAKSLSARKKELQNQVWFTIFLLLSTFVKESFIILVPAILFLKVWQEALVFKITLLDSLKRNLSLIIFFSIVVAAEISIIYYYKSTSNHFIEYVSIDADTFKPYNLLISITRLLVTKGYFIVIAPAVIMLIVLRKKISSWTSDVNHFFLPLAILFVLIVLPQVILYSKSLIFERYLLPGTLGCGFLVIYLQQYISHHDKQLLKLPQLFLPACILLLLLQFTLMTRGAILYANDGYAVKKVLTTIINNTSAEDTILEVARPQGQSEPAQSVKAYLNAAIGGYRKNVFIEPVIDSSIRLDKIGQSDVINFLEITKGARYNNISDKSAISCILFFENMRSFFLNAHPEIDTTNFQRFDITPFTVYCKKKSNKY